MTIGDARRMQSSAPASLMTLDGALPDSEERATEDGGMPPPAIKRTAPEWALSAALSAQRADRSADDFSAPPAIKEDALAQDELQPIAAADPGAAAAEKSSVAATMTALSNTWDALEAEAAQAWETVEALLRSVPPDLESAGRIVSAFVIKAQSALVAGAKACIEACTAYPGGEAALLEADPDAAEFIKTAKELDAPFWDELAHGRQLAAEAWEKQLAEDEKTDLLEWIEKRLEKSAEIAACNRVRAQLKRMAAVSRSSPN